MREKEGTSRKRTATKGANAEEYVLESEVLLEIKKNRITKKVKSESNATLFIWIVVVWFLLTSANDLFIE